MVVARGYMYSATKEYELNCTLLFPCVFVSRTRFFYLGSSIILPTLLHLSHHFTAPTYPLRVTEKIRNLLKKSCVAANVVQYILYHHYYCYYD